MVIAATALWLYGAIHVVFGEGLGLATCWKHGWSLSDTFVDFARLNFTGDLPDKVVVAMNHCTLTEDPGAWSRDRIILIAALVVVLVALGVAVRTAKLKSE